jgi:hypothetical protein
MHKVRTPQGTCQRDAFHLFWDLENTFKVKVEMSVPSPAEYEHLNSLEFSKLFISGGWSKVRSTGHNGAKSGREFWGCDSFAHPWQSSCSFGLRSAG